MSAADVTPEWVEKQRGYAKSGLRLNPAPMLDLLDSWDALSAEVAALRRQAKGEELTCKTCLHEKTCPKAGYAACMFHDDVDSDVSSPSADVVTAPDGFEVIEFGSTSGANGFPQIQRKGPHSWAIYADPMYCLGKDGNFHPEPLPSSRSDEFIALTRFATPHEAAEALRSGEAGKEREA